MSKKSKIKNQKSKIHTASSERGFTLLLAALVASVVLSIGAAIFSIALKQVTLASVGRNSQSAFYAADTAAECALYWDIRFAAFATSTDSTGYATEIRCAETTLTMGDVNFDISDADDDSATTRFQYDVTNYDPEDLDAITGYNCAVVTAGKRLSAQTGGIVTTIHADGYSTSCQRLDTDPQVLQRSVELHY